MTALHNINTIRYVNNIALPLPSLIADINSKDIHPATPQKTNANVIETILTITIASAVIT